MALGDGNGSSYTPTGLETALRNELARKAIDRRQFLGGNTWRVKAEFGTGTPVINVREAGFFDESGDLVVICTFAENEERKTGAVTYLIDEVLNFSLVQDGLVYVEAPDDELFDLAVSVSTSLANLQLEQLRQADELRALKNGGQT